MKRPLATLTTAIALTALALPAWATTIENQDTNAHELDVITEQGTKTVTIDPGAKIEDICAGCTLYLIGAEEDLNVAANDQLVIKDGKLELIEQ